MNYDILVVDDSKAALFLFKKIIGLSGAPVNRLLTAENGLEAIEVLKENSIDLIMTDINMPEMNGFQLIEHLKNNENYHHIPVIVITTEGRDTYIEKAKALGAVDYIKKPFQPEQIKQLILKTLGVDENDTDVDDVETSDF
ncbi:MAG: response regulator [bacterium]|nr:response regulator [bacterium]